MTPDSRFLDRRSPPHIMTLVLLAGLPALSLNIFLPSLPAMASHFGVSYSTMQLSLSLYLVATAVLQILVGPISDMMGRRPVMLATTAIFILATFGALVAPNYGVFLVCRLLQATMTAGLVLSRAVVRDIVSQDQAASMIGYVTMGMSIVPMVGPVIGGALEEAWSWHGSFVLLLLGGLGLFALIWADMGETAQRAGSGFAEQVRQYPELLKARRFWGYCLSAASAAGAFYAYLGGAPYVGSEVFGMDPATLGLWFGAPAVGYMAGNYLSGRFAMRLGVNRMVLIGTLFTTAGLLALTLLTLAGFTAPAVFFGSIVTVGLGNGVVLPSANAGMLSVRPRLAGSASGLGGAFMIGGGAALSVLAGAVLGPGSGALPLVLLMLASSVMSVVFILWVLARERSLRRSGGLPG
ncbi:multidrug effflux MFS transporter [Tabrizicola sp. J26]|uniref:multidrug effflux MFS transporter n=1 Tax=Alitabrizicola rongguiensis TaxID=2909234 RepID=UPI001F2879E1|nr:multidrug effflux MFS transporter [Tabrizicola rongguiensis]MCF1708880.1 multidrug effflux MFS transporter [Tabrizicola rongguiensis]